MFKYFITFLIFIIFFIVFKNYDKKNEDIQVKRSNIEQVNKTYIHKKPKTISFCGEQAPIENQEIWERLDKEILKNSFFHSNTILYIKRANKYFPTIEKILKENNIPDDFKYLCLIESGLENVVSPKDARGYWQILEKTGKAGGLEINKYIDERYHLEKSTEFACKYLKESYERFNSWTLAAASYNMGKRGLERQIEKQKTNDYYKLLLNSETAKYVFRIMAVKHILENRIEFGFLINENDLYYLENFQNITIDSSISSIVSFSLSLNSDYKTIKKLNPWIRQNRLPNKSKKEYTIKIPK
ncbi:MAG: murein transglycosylase [Flavobacteriales bacterium]|nr:murein transglycosylase [Flavobacteriales bacterium]|tara:strand:+ start:191 stop:1090 length:900 start_codon:yes stop_codon:yes gene_type:complete